MSNYNDKVLKSVANAVMDVMKEELKGNQHKADQRKAEMASAKRAGPGKDILAKIKAKKTNEEFEQYYTNVGEEMSNNSYNDIYESEDDERAKRKSTWANMIGDAEARKKQKEFKERPKHGYLGNPNDESEPQPKKKTKAEKAKDTYSFPTSTMPEKKKEVDAHLSDDEFKAKHGMSRKNFARSQAGVKIGESFSNYVNAYRDYGLVALSEMTQLVEEPTNDEWTEELHDQEASMSGKKRQPKVAKGAVMAVQSEDYNIHEESHEDFLARMGAKPRPRLEDQKKAREQQIKDRIAAGSAAPRKRHDPYQLGGTHKLPGNRSANEEYEQVEEGYGYRSRSSELRGSLDSSSRRRRGFTSSMEHDPYENPNKSKGKAPQSDKEFKDRERNAGVREEVEQIDEISRATAQSYISKAAPEIIDMMKKSRRMRNRVDATDPSDSMKGIRQSIVDKLKTKIEKRTKGVIGAAKRTAKNEEYEYLDEIAGGGLSTKTLKSYREKAKISHAERLAKHRELAAQADKAAEENPNDVEGFYKHARARDRQYADAFKRERGIRKANKVLDTRDKD